MGSSRSAMYNEPSACQPREALKPLARVAGALMVASVSVGACVAAQDVLSGLRGLMSGTFLSGIDAGMRDTDPSATKEHRGARSELMKIRSQTSPAAARRHPIEKD